MLRRYWFEFDDSASFGLPFGCGVTAEDAASALHIVAETYCDGRGLPVARETVEDVDVGELADRLSAFVRPLRIGVPTVKGIWYPSLTGP